MNVSRIMVAAPASGSGKTVVTCALLRALQRRGLTPAAFKCGPDYIDPLFHRRVVGTASGNLDGFFSSADELCSLLARGAQGADIAVLEGVMGLYDGMAPGNAQASSYQVARDTDTPVVLVVDGKGASLSLAAVVKGVAEFMPDAGVAGVILNRVSKAAFEYSSAAIEEYSGVAVLGYIPADAAFELESRHLGLVCADEVADLSARIDCMAAALEETVDIERLVGIAAGAPALPAAPYRLDRAVERPVRVAVARDDAFSFYYEENLRVLEDLGAELAFFSPLEDEALPEGAGALYIGGGYPELTAARLSANEAMRASVRAAAWDGMPTIAECGGFMYLLESITDEHGIVWPMAGVFAGGAKNLGRLHQFGYIELESKQPSVYGPVGTKIRAHEFHYWHADDAGNAFWAQKPLRKKGWPCIQASKTTVAGFPHVYFPANPEVARSFVRAAAAYAAKRFSGSVILSGARSAESKNLAGEDAGSQVPACGCLAVPGSLLASTIAAIEPASEEVRRKTHACWDNVAHPLNGLGLLEDAIADIAAAQGSVEVELSPRALAVFFADNGVVSEDISQSTQEVTAAVARNMSEGVTSACRMAELANCSVVCVDVGMASVPADARMVDAHVRRGTDNIACGPAMARVEAFQAIEAGIAQARRFAEGGVRLAAAGEMGIGNTTTSAAVASVLLGIDPAVVVGRGAGLDDDALERKRRVVARAIELNAPNAADPIDILAKLGGFDIAAMCGFYIGAASCKLPVVLDGVISCVAALLAVRIEPKVRGYLVASHTSSEPAARLLLDELSLVAPLEAGMHLGEGAGALAFLPLLDSTLAVYRSGRSFAETGIDAYEHLGSGQ